jgi:outer membrane receptor protein involved in Fe transport
LILFATAGIIETEFTDFVDGNDDFSGNEFPYAPNLSFNLGADWRVGDHWQIFGDINWEDNYFSDQSNEPGFEVESRTLINAKVSYSWDRYRLSVFTRNLLDEDYLLQAFPTGARGGEPRVAGIEFSLNP